MNLAYQLFEQIWWLVPLLIIVIFLKTPWFKGLFGEWLVKVSAKYFLDKSIYCLLYTSRCV